MRDCDVLLVVCCWCGTAAMNGTRGFPRTMGWSMERVCGHGYMISHNSLLCTSLLLLLLRGRNNYPKEQPFIFTPKRAHRKRADILAYLGAGGRALDRNGRRISSCFVVLCPPTQGLIFLFFLNLYHP